MVARFDAGCGGWHMFSGAALACLDSIRRCLRRARRIDVARLRATPRLRNRSDSMSASRMSRYALFIGTWNTTGDVRDTEAGPASTLIATDTYAWLPGRGFIVHHVDARFDGKPARSMEVMGYDAAREAWFAQSFDDQGTTESFDVALQGRRWTIDGKAVRFRGSFDARKDRLSGLWERKTRRGRWQPWIDLELVRT